MRKHMIAVVGLVCLTFAGCAKDDAPMAKAAAFGGVEQGNGMTTYTNEKMGIAFAYPVGWRLTENESRDRIALDNTTVGGSASTTSKLEFSLTPDLAGEKFKDTAELERTLKRSQPQKEWVVVSFHTGQSGFFWRNSPDASDRVYRAEYYLLDQNYNVLTVKYHAVADLDGIGVVKKIISSLSLDLTAPLLNRIYFEPAEAKAGDTVRLVLEMWDEVNDVNEGTLNKDEYFYANDWPGWHRLETVERIGRSQHAFPLFNNFSRTAPTRYEYSFKVPEGMPEGDITLRRYSLADIKGNYLELNSTENSSQYELGSRGASRVSANQPNLTLPKLKVSRPVGSAPSDSTPPKLKRVWFEKSLLVGGINSHNTMYLEVEDEYDLRMDQYHFRFGFSEIAMDYASLTKLRTGLYSASLRMLSNYCHSAPGPRMVGLQYLQLVDEVGNAILISSRDGELPEVGFLWSNPCSR